MMVEEKYEEKYFEMPEDRQKEILRIIQDKRIAKIPELSMLCGVSEATIRRDLNVLDRQGLIHRKHGGAIRYEKSAYEQPYLDKLEMMIVEKKRIAAKAASLISDGESIFLDSSSTTFPIVSHLSERKYLTVTTTNIDIIKTIVLHPTSQLIIVGGMLRKGYNAIIGPFAESFIKNMKIDKTFIGADAIDVDTGIYSCSFIEFATKQASIHCGRSRFLLADSSKFNKMGMIKICDLDEFQYIITDTSLAEDIVGRIQATNTKILLT